MSAFRCPICSQLHPLAQCETYSRASAGLVSFVRRIWSELPTLAVAGETWERVFELYAAVPGVELADSPEWNVWFPARAIDGLQGAREAVCLSVKPQIVATVWDALLPKLRTMQGVKRAKWRLIRDNRDGVETIVVYLENRQARDKLIDTMDRMHKRRRAGSTVIPGELREDFFQLAVAKGSAPVDGLKGVSIAASNEAKRPRAVQIAEIIGSTYDRMPAGSKEADTFVGSVLSAMVEEGIEIGKPFRRIRLPRLAAFRGSAK